MTLHLYDVEQGSADWLDLRRGVLTASEMSGLITPKTIKVASNADTRAITNKLVAERITGHVDPTYLSDDMIRGQMEEPLARARYEETTGRTVTTLGLMVRDGGTLAGRLGYSPDGLVDDDGLLEIKSRRQDKHLQTILSDTVPAEFMAQIQTGLRVSGRDWCDFISYSGGMPMWTRRVTPIPEWQTAIDAALEVFEEAAAEMEQHYYAAVVGLPETERVDFDLDLVV
jgi:hypothetical protein